MKEEHRVVSATEWPAEGITTAMGSMSLVSCHSIGLVRVKPVHDTRLLLKTVLEIMHS